ncbi:diadenylate cyclase CdaA [Mogibacterium pumilum]|uniref:Diadenylate cyclase n=1 Tax=Mogibacterium pumilum TaxID=86332 RepID=A0A223ARH0_9FIRM|nr:diadenylate cyclase CdaA [Mogibacterium pumilum]ASS37532.1 TIGR00159 family protein [Mogibacterium pumilum]
MLSSIQSIISNFRLEDALDIAIVSYIVYKMIGFIRETRAMQLIRGLVIIVVAFFISDIFNLYLLNWLLKSLFTMGLFAVVVLFQPELRRALEQVGRKNLMNTNSFRNIDKNKAVETVDALVSAIDDFSATRTGALIAIERDTMLNDIIETGVVVDAEISIRLLGNLFYEGSPLHDGGVIIRGARIHAASCVFPLTEKKNIGRNLGTRHRAGVGLSEVCDALIIIVSEETGVVSIAEDGKIRRFVDLKTIEKMLLNMYLPSDRGMYGKVAKLVRRKGGKRDAK